MNRGWRTLVMVVACTALLGTTAGASVAAKPRQVSKEAYAKTMCKAYDKLLANVNGFGDDISSLEVTDPATFQSDVGVAGDEVLGKLAKVEKKLKSVYPDVDDGKKISKLFAKNSVELQDLLSAALDKFAAADPTSPAFQADVVVFTTSLSTIGIQLTDVTSQITDQDFIGAVGDEEACHENFPVVGG